MQEDSLLSYNGDNDYTLIESRIIEIDALIGIALKPAKRKRFGFRTCRLPSSTLISVRSVYRFSVAALIHALYLVTFVLPSLIVLWNIASFVLFIASSLISIVWEISLPWSGLLPFLFCAVTIVCLFSW